ncbi:hypothetical protein GCM10010430_18480 [Kitasatospora cystarginea]|uniref:Secreted protein n=1 Tax=Kitasatospora cystarginea TaxID=58350 RepID=A0ABN3DPC3_9ACTN
MPRAAPVTTATRGVLLCSVMLVLVSLGGVTDMAAAERGPAPMGGQEDAEADTLPAGSPRGQSAESQVTEGEGIR